SGNDAEDSPAPCELTDASAMLPLEEGLDVETEGELDRFAGGARRRDDDDASRGRLELHESIAIGRKPVSILDRARHGRGRCKVGAQMKSPLIERAFLGAMVAAVAAAVV